jgi:hypothetical protein
LKLKSERIQRKERALITKGQELFGNANAYGSQYKKSHVAVNIAIEHISVSRKAAKSACC